MFEIKLTELERAIKTAPQGYAEIIYSNREKHLDTATSIFMHPTRYKLIKEWKQAAGKKTLEELKSAQPKSYEFHHNSTGIGDSVCAIYVACGLAEATNKRVKLYTRTKDWLLRAWHPLVDLKDYAEIGPSASNDYSAEIRYSDTRKNHYCRNIAKAFGLPDFLPKPPKRIETIYKNRVYPGKYIVLAPYSHWPARNWDKWTELAKAIEAIDYKVIAIGISTHNKELERDFSGTSATWYYGKSPAEVIEIMLGADLVIGNDSGPAHLSGLLGINAIAVHAGSLNHEFLFDLAPTVKSVTPDLYLQRNDHNTAALHSVSVERVMKAVISHVKTAPQPARDCGCTRRNKGFTRETR